MVAVASAAAVGTPLFCCFWHEHTFSSPAVDFFLVATPDVPMGSAAASCNGAPLIESLGRDGTQHQACVLVPLPLAFARSLLGPFALRK